MMWNDGGWWLPAALVFIVCMVMMVRMMGHGAHGSHADQSQGRSSAGPERILAERLARGEIDVEEYQRRLAALRQRNEAGHA
jgi:putative membrane protein